MVERTARVILCQDGKHYYELTLIRGPFETQVEAGHAARAEIVADTDAAAGPALSDRELAAVLAGLRLLQRRRGMHDYPVEIDAIEWAEGYLADGEIDALCERLNSGGG